MNVRKYFIIYGITTSTVGFGLMFFLGKKYGETKVKGKIKSMGHLNVAYGQYNKPELYLNIDKESLKSLSNTKYAVFDVSIIEPISGKTNA